MKKITVLLADDHTIIREGLRLLLETARAADLVVTASPEGASSGSPYRSIDLGSLRLSALLVPALVAGMFLGERLFRRLDARTFERLVLVLLIVVGSALALHAI